jgi:hypothetical protein
LPLRPLPEMHGARQDRQHDDDGTAPGLAADLAEPLRRRLTRNLGRGVEGDTSLGGGLGHGRGERGKPRLLQRQVLVSRMPK